MVKQQSKCESKAPAFRLRDSCFENQLPGVSSPCSDAIEKSLRTEWGTGVFGTFTASAMTSKHKKSSESKCAFHSFRPFSVIHSMIKFHDNIQPFREIRMICRIINMLASFCRIQIPSTLLASGSSSCAAMALALVMSCSWSCKSS